MSINKVVCFKERYDLVNLKKILLFSFAVIFIPFIIVNLFIKKEEITFNYSTNVMVRVYLEKEKQVLTIPLEKYVVGVVAAEMPASFSSEALKAQAVASRTYVMYKIENNKNNEYDVYDSEASQVFLQEEELKHKWNNNYIENINKIKQAVLDTLGECLAYNGEIIEAFFFSTSTGYTENSEDVFNEQLPYLRSVESKWDEESPVYNDIQDFELHEFLSLLDISDDNELNVKVITQTKTGRIKNISINGKEFTGREVCEKLGLKSSFFEIIQEGQSVIVKTKGYGHGVGMSQYGANGMAKSGYTYDEILKYYYSGVEIEKT